MIVTVILRGDCSKKKKKKINNSINILSRYLVTTPRPGNFVNWTRYRLQRSEGRARDIDAFYTHQSKLEEQETRFPVHHRGTDMSLVFDSIYSATTVPRIFFSAQCC